MKINIKDFLQKYGLAGACLIGALLFADVVFLNIKMAKLNERANAAETLLIKLAKGEMPLLQVGEKDYRPIIPLLWRDVQDLKELKLGPASESDKFELSQ